MRSADELFKYKNDLLEEVNKEDLVVVEVALSTCGITAGAKKVYDELESIIIQRKIENVILRQTGCPGLCYKEPLMTIIHPGNDRRVYGGISSSDLPEIVEEDIINKRPVRSCLVNIRKQEDL